MSQMNKILKRMYAKELELIEEAPSIDIRKLNPVWVVKEYLWVRQSAAIKLAIFALTVSIIAGGVYFYNFFTINSFQVKMEWAHIEAQLQRRKDLIPNLVTAVNNYTAYEKNVFIHAADVRAAVESIEETMKVSDQVPQLDTSFLSKFQAVAEAYPALKASEAYQTLMKELSATETMIVDKRLSYNRVANFHNSRLKMFPGNIFNIVFRFDPVNTFESEEAAKTAPKVNN